MKDCPDTYFDNCKNSSFKCNICRAGKGGRNGQLYYKPINPQVTHPLSNKKPLGKKSHQIKKALKEEKKIVADIKNTLASGRILQDGDISINDLNLDSKVRYTSSSFTVTKAEYQKGIRQSLDGWVITNQDKERVFVLTEEAFIKLISQHKQ